MNQRRNNYNNYNIRIESRFLNRTQPNSFQTKSEPKPKRNKQIIPHITTPTSPENTLTTGKFWL